LFAGFESYVMPEAEARLPEILGAGGRTVGVPSTSHRQFDCCEKQQARPGLGVHAIKMGKLADRIIKGTLATVPKEKA